MSEAPARLPVLAASIAVFRDGEVLLVERAKPPGRGLYSLPGGRIEPGERLADGVMRELQEETGLAARIIGFVDHVEYIERDPSGALLAHVVILAYAGEWTGGEPILTDEVSDVIWVDPLQPANVPMTAGLPAILMKAAKLAREAGVL